MPPCRASVMMPNLAGLVRKELKESNQKGRNLLKWRAVHNLLDKLTSCEATSRQAYKQRAPIEKPLPENRHVGSSPRE